MPRLPIPGGDESHWGDILNDYLEQIHTPIGGLKANTVNTAQLANGSITAEKLAAATAPTTGQQLTYNGTALHWQTPTTPATPEVIPTDAQIIVASDAPASWQALKATKATGTNDHLTLQTAINNGPVLLSPGTFFLNGPISVNTPNPHVFGSGWSTRLYIVGGSNTWAFEFEPQAGYGVRGYFAQFQIDGNSANQTDGGGIHASGAVQTEFHFIHFRNCYNAGLWLDGFADNSFGHHNKVTSCLFDGEVPATGLARGLLIENSDENYIRSEFQFLGGSAGQTYAVRDTSGLNIYDGSVFVGGRNNMGGIELRNGSRSQVHGCMFDGVSGHSIFVAASTAHIITANTFTSVADQATTNGAFSGIYLEFGAQQCIITNNLLETSPTANKTHSLIREDAMGDSGSNIISQNMLRQVNAGTPSAGFMQLNGTGSHVSVNGINGVIS